MSKEAENVCDQGADAAEAARANHLGRNFPKEAFDQVEPGRGGWGKMQMKAPMTFKPGDDLGMFVSSVVVGVTKERAWFKAALLHAFGMCLYTVPSEG